jgi:multiple sugar transport system substrate-binding protein
MSGISRRAVVTAAALNVAWACSAPRVDSIVLAVRAALPAEQVALDNTIQAFTAATGIVVKREVITDEYMDVLRSRFAARKTPDVFYLEAAEAPLLIKSGVLEPFDGRIDRPDDFFPRFLAAFRGDDRKVYGLPKDYSTLALFLNTRLLAQAGYRPDEVPKDFNSMMAFAKALQARLPAGTAAMIYERDLARHLSAIEAFGTPVVAANGDAQLSTNAAALGYLDAFVRGRREGYLQSPKDDFGSDSPGAAFGSGRAAMMMDGNWVLGSLRHDYPDVPFTVREMPLVNGMRHTMAFVVGLSVSRFARNKEGGIRFAQFMTGSGMAQWSRQSGTLPSRRSVQDEMRLSDDPIVGAFTRGADYATVWTRGTGLPIINTNFGNQFLAALNGSKPVAEAMRRAEVAANREIERQK